MNIFEIEKYLNQILEPWNFDDFCNNGIQVEGKHEVKKIAYGVSFNEEFIDKALESGADMLLVHHGIFGKGLINIRGVLKKRIEKLIKNDLTLMGYHLSLDAHAEYGNNISILRALDLELVEKVDCGFSGRYNQPMKFEEFEDKLKKVFPKSDLLIYKNSDTVQNVGIISGGAASYVNEFEGKIDTYITGAVNESTRDWVKEAGINFINPGHYYTETFGVENIAKLLNENFGLETIFIDVPNKI